MTINYCDELRASLIPVADMSSTKGKKGSAAVLVPLMLVNDEWRVVLTLRSSQLRHHSGEVAFPGGMWEEGDNYPVGTALRESEEEIALPAKQVDVLGGLTEMPTRRLQQVRPIVGNISSKISFVANKAEIDAIFTVPLAFFKDDVRIRTDIFRRDAIASHSPNEADPAITVSQWVPAYEYQGYEIWGFTAAVIVKLMNQCFSAKIARKNSAPEKIW